MSKRAEIKTRLNILKALAGLHLFEVKCEASTIKELDKLAFKILTQAKRRAPIRTGALRASGRVMPKGLKTRIIGFGGAGTGVNYAGTVEYGSATNRPQPYLRPAFFAVKKEYGKNLVRSYKNNWAIASRLGSSL
tara:strand:+ start:45471 stop:45875 length:405 start_codon:yes stop_codon:yes gene_type:complete